MEHQHHNDQEENRDQILKWVWNFVYAIFYPFIMLFSLLFWALTWTLSLIENTLIAIFGKKD